MDKSKKWFKSRIVLYSVGLALSCTLLLAGFVLDPKYKMRLEDYEADLALNVWSGNQEAAMENIKTIMELDPENLYGLLMEAYLRIQVGEEREALDLYERSLALCWKQPDLEDEILDSLSRLELRAGRYAEARDHALRRIHLVGENNTSRLIIALSSFSLHDDKGFEENLDRAMSMGILGPAFQMKLDQLMGGGDKLINLYLKMLSERSRREGEPWENAWKKEAWPQ